MDHVDHVDHVDRVAQTRRREHQERYAAFEQRARAGTLTREELLDRSTGLTHMEQEQLVEAAGWTWVRRRENAYGDGVARYYNVSGFLVHPETGQRYTQQEVHEAMGHRYLVHLDGKDVARLNRLIADDYARRGGLAKDYVKPVRPQALLAAIVQSWLAERYPSYPPPVSEADEAGGPGEA